MFFYDFVSADLCVLIHIKIKDEDGTVKLA